MARLYLDFDTSSLFSTKIMRRLAKTLLVVVIVAGLLFASVTTINRVTEANSKQPFNTDEYNIVFLDNNLFYFCQLEDSSSEYLECNNPYYLVRRDETSEDGTKEEKIYVRQPVDEEIYEPEGPIYLKKDRVVYIAKIGEESPVLQFIESDLAESESQTTNSLPQVIEEIPLD